MMNFNRQKNTGLSIIELMISMAVGLILIGGIASVYIASKRSYLEVERMSRMTQNGRFAIQMVTEAIQHAGFVGEVPIGNIVQDVNLDALAADCNDSAAAYDVEHYLFGATADANGAALGCIADAMPNSSIILIKNVRPMRLVDSDDNGTIDTPLGIDNQTTYIISNNSRGVLFDGADTQPTITDGGDVPNGSAWEYQVQLYYVRDTAGDGSNPTLARRFLSWNAGAMGFVTEDLIAGVEAMSFLFGMDTTGNGEIDSYKTIGEMDSIEWTQVAAVEVDALVRSETEDPNMDTSQTRTFNLGGLAAAITADDNFHRLVMQNTVSLRNPKFVLRGNL